MQHIPTLITPDADVMNALHVSINRWGFFFNGDDHATKKKKRRERASNLCSRQLDHKQDSFCPNRPCLYLPVDARQPRPSRKQNKIVFVTIDLIRIDVVDVVGVAVQQVSNYTVLWMHHTQPQSAILGHGRAIGQRPPVQWVTSTLVLLRTHVWFRLLRL